MSSDTWFDGSIEAVKMLFEEGLLFFVNRMNDIVVISYNKHHIFSEDSQTFFLLKQFGNIVRNCNKTKSLNLGPVRHLNDDLVKVRVEVALKKTTFL